MILANIRSERFKMSNVATLSYKSYMAHGKKNKDRPQTRSQRLSSYRPRSAQGGGKMTDAGNEARSPPPF